MNLNLARKWRSKTFDEMVGQDLAIRMLKNSLYLNHFFPVYLFSGQRGCGKTTAARIFAAAVNCEKLSSFRQDPKSHTLPCLSCSSCQAMAAGRHPDFIEIDAASHTGVDHVRQIIDAASLLPVLGNKKIYLIDEAHMLSKAAFNAFLKLLEEPPTSVFFILATTDAHKIIETVLSRCFQLLFKAIPEEPLINHLAYICKQENISYTQEGIKEIALNGQGSVRDTLNLLEQVRFSTACVDREAVLGVLGKMRIEDLIKILDTALSASPDQLGSLLISLAIERYNPFDLWQSLIHLLCDIAWLTLNVPIKHTHIYQELSHISKHYTFAQISSYLDIFYQHESLLQKTKTPHTLLTYVLLKIGNKQNHIPLKTIVPVSASPQHDSNLAKPLSSSSVLTEKWQEFMQRIETIDDPLILSVFKRAQLDATSNDQHIIITFPENLTFFKDIIDRTQRVWLSELHIVFTSTTQLQYTFTATPQTVIEPSKAIIPQLPIHNIQPSTPKEPIHKKPDSYSKNFTRYPERKKNEPLGKTIDVSDASIWVKTNLILEFFPGNVTEINEDIYG